jgi:type IV pilus assembly protein PilE
MTTRRSGFTLIELLVVVAIISIIAAIGFVAYSGYVEAAKKKTSATSDAVEAALIEGAELFTDEVGYNVCIIENNTRNYYIVSERNGGGCKIKLDGKQVFTREGC